MPKKKQQSKRKISETIPNMFDNLEESFFSRPCLILSRSTKNYVHVK